MAKHYPSYLKVFVLLLIASMAGCSRNSSTPLSPSNQAMQPKGSITGLVKNFVTGEPVVSAKVSIGYNGSVQSVTTDNSGAFSFGDVPAGQYQILNGAIVASGTYTLTVSLVDYNSSQTDSTKKYRDYYYNTVNIVFTSAVDSSSNEGLVGSVLFNISYLNTTLKGQVVDQNVQPVANALVTLVDETINPGVAIAQTTTASDGSYIFMTVDNGITVNVKAVSQDGSLQGNLPAFLRLPANLTIDSLRTGVTAEQIMIKPADDTQPYVISITPENNSDVSPTNLQIVYTFSEPIKQTFYTGTGLPVGSKTMLDDIKLNFIGMKKTTDAFGFSAQWNAAFSQLTISPQGLVPSAQYSLDMTAAFNSGKITDAAGNILVNNPKITGDFELLNFTTEGGSTPPVAPTLTQRFVSNTYGNVDFDGGTIGLEWNYDPNARSYNIYKSVDGGSFVLLQSNYEAIQFSDNTGSLVVPAGAADPLSAGSVSYLIRGVSRDLVEGPSSNVITITDKVSPRLLNVSIAPSGGADNWIYTLSFSEPLTVSNAEVASNYAILNPDTVSFNISKASYLGYNQTSTRYQVELQVSTNLPQPAGYSLQVNLAGVTDLAGNSIDNTSNIFTFSIPPTPKPAQPADGASAVGLPVTMVWQAANGATSYHLQISTLFTFATTVLDQEGITTTSISVGSPTLTTGTLYYWRVQALNAAGTTAYSAPRHFTP